jgi:micrococcal nuclease
VKRFYYIILLLFTVLGAGCDSDNSSSTGPGDSDDYTTRTATVSYVYDGDTIQVNSSEKVRYIGIDTPERGECYYWEATLRNRELVDKRTVVLEICKASPEDQYGRTLAHVYVNSTNINALLIQEGYAKAYRVPPCTTRADEYSGYERDARNSGRGRWSACQ